MNSTESWRAFFDDAKLTKKEISKCLPIFIKNEADQMIISEITEHDLKEMGIEAVFTRKKIMKHVKEITKDTRGDEATTMSRDKSREDSLFPTNIILDQFSIRRTVYIKWTNSNNVRELFRSTLRDINEYFKSYYLEIDLQHHPERDILTSIRNNKKKRLGLETCDRISFDFKVTKADYTLSTPIYISKEILAKCFKSEPASSMNSVRTQHVRLHSHMVDIDTFSSSSSVDTKLDDDEGSPSKKKKLDENLELLKKIKTCQLAKYARCSEQLALHQKNNSEFVGNQAYANVLIFIKDYEICQRLANYLGFICVENAILQGNINANINEVLQIRTANKNAYLWRLIQSYINIELMFGCSNICLTSNCNIFTTVNAQSKCIILKKSDEMCRFHLLEYANFVVNINNGENHLIYISAIAEMLNMILNVEASIPAILYETNSKNYCNVNVPLSSLVPLYILEFFSQVLNKDCTKNKLSYSSI